jgi:hypothetical protein
MIRAIILLTVQIALLLHINIDDPYFTFHAAIDAEESDSMLDNLGWWLFRLSSILLFLALVDVSLGIIYGWDAMQKQGQLMRWVAYGFGFIKLVLSTLGTGKYLDVDVKYNKDFRTDSTFDSMQALSASEIPYGKVLSAYGIMMWVASLATLVFSIYSAVVLRNWSDHHQVRLWPLHEDNAKF